MKAAKSLIATLSEVSPAQARLIYSRQGNKHWTLASLSDGLWQLEKGRLSERRRIRQLEDEDGTLVGTDAGEFGGGLMERDRSGKVVKLHPPPQWAGFETPPNVLFLTKLGPRVIAIRGLNHLGSDDGSVEIYRGCIGKGLLLESAVPLPECPSEWTIQSRRALWIPMRLGLLQVRLPTLELTLYALTKGAKVSTTWRRRRSISPRALQRRTLLAQSESRSAWQGLPISSVLSRGRKIYVAAGPAVVELVVEEDSLKVRWLMRPGLVPQASPYRETDALRGRKLGRVALRGTTPRSFRHSAVPASLTKAYLETEFRILGKTPLTLTVGEKTKPLWLLFPYEADLGAAILTAWNPFSRPTSRRANAVAQKQFVQELEWLGLPHMKASGVHPSGQWPGEPSLLILGIDLATACKLGRILGQNGLVWIGRNNIPELVLLR